MALGTNFNHAVIKRLKNRLIHISTRIPHSPATLVAQPPTLASTSVGAIPSRFHPICQLPAASAF